MCFNQEEGAYIQQITTIDGQTVQQLMTGDNQVTEVRAILNILPLHVWNAYALKVKGICFKNNAVDVFALTYPLIVQRGITRKSIKKSFGVTTL